MVFVRSSPSPPPTPLTVHLHYAGIRHDDNRGFSFSSLASRGASPALRNPSPKPSHNPINPTIIKASPQLLTTGKNNNDNNKNSLKFNPEQFFNRHCSARVLWRNDCSILLTHELKSKRVSLNHRFVVSVLQNQENPLHPLRFYLRASNIDPSLTRNQSVRRVRGNALFRKGPLVLSADLVQEIRKSGFSVTEDLLCVLIGSWGRLGFAKYCVEVWFLGLSPSTRLYNAFIDALVKSNSVDLAYLKFQQISGDNCVPDRFTYNILIHGVCKVGVVDEPLRLVKQMEGVGYCPNVSTYATLNDGFCNAKRVEETLGLLKTTQERNVRPNEEVIGSFRCVAPREAFNLGFGFVEKESLYSKAACDSFALPVIPWPEKLPSF